MEKRQMFLVQQTQPQGYQWPLGLREQKLLFQALVCNWLELCVSEPITGPSIPEKRNLLWLPVGTRCGTANSSTYQRPQLLISPSHTCQQIMQYARDLLGGCLLNRNPPPDSSGHPQGHELAWLSAGHVLLGASISSLGYDCVLHVSWRIQFVVGPIDHLALAVLTLGIKSSGHTLVVADIGIGFTNCIAASAPYRYRGSSPST